MNRNRWVKILGVAGAAGVVATGALIARDERARRAYTPDEVRERLQRRAIAGTGEAPEPDDAGR
ncbi:hypothetical protein [uncultured Phycicoccus sp.]|uniref:hypothetical protein n=1 Tax=uncultured Phycicoccus sp. TaxID=661422 RepID=UPI0026284EDA|nr:hypothetical protein [uncultured Phycicoccus sp.]